MANVYVKDDVNHDVNAAFAVAANALPNRQRRRPNFNRVIRVPFALFDGKRIKNIPIFQCD